MQLQDNISCPKLFIGLDVHKKTWSVSIQTDLFFHKTYSMPTKPGDLYDYVSNHFADYVVSLVYEAGGCGFHAARYFLNLGWEVMVVNPADIRRGDKERYQKTDALDSRKLSNYLKRGELTGIYIPTEEHEQFLSLARHRTQVTRKFRQTKLQIKSMLLFSRD